MGDRPSLTPRLLAPAAVVVFALLALAILIGSGTLSGGGSADQASNSSKSQDDRPARRTRQGRSRARTTYTVKAGDTLGAIAGRTGVSIDRLQELNPQLDPQALTAGQKIKLRE